MKNSAMKMLFFMLGLVLAASVVPAYAGLGPCTRLDPGGEGIWFTPWNASAWSGKSSPAYGRAYDDGSGYTLLYYDASCGSSIGTANAWILKSGDCINDAPPSSVTTTAGAEEYCIPAPTEPETCQNTIKDPDEDGIDCGGVCADECLYSCQEGYSPETRTGSDGFVSTVCIADSDPVAPLTDGSCPKGTLPRDGSCFTWGLPGEKADQDYFDSQTELTAPDPVDSSPETESTTDTDIEKITNPDGTETETITSTTTIPNVDNSTTVTTTTTINNYDASGQLTGSTTTSSSTTTPGGDPLADLNGDGVPDGAEETTSSLGGSGDLGLPGADGTDRGIINDVNFTPLEVSTANLMNKAPFAGLDLLPNFFDSWIVESPVAPSLSIQFHPQIDPVNMDLTLIDPLASFFRTMCAALVVLLGIYGAIRPWRG